MEDLREFESLVSSAGVEAMQVITGSRKAPHPKYFVGEGKAVEIADAVKATGASVVLFDHALSPARSATGSSLRMPCYRSHGIDFRHFAQRARTHEGNCRLSWRSCVIWQRVWCVAGPTLKDKRRDWFARPG